jgi:hypothetical protein
MASDKMVVAPPRPADLSVSGLEAIEAKVRKMLASGYMRRWTTFRKGSEVIKKKDDEAVADVVYALCCAREMGIPDHFMLRHGYVTPGGDMSVDSHILMAIYKAHGGHFKVMEQDENHSKVMFWDDDGGEYISEFCVDDAKRSGVYRDGGPWQKDPRNQTLRSALARGARTLRPDWMGGVFWHGEMGLPVGSEGELDLGSQGEVDISDLPTEESEDPQEYVQDVDSEPCVTEADLEEFKQWCNAFAEERQVDILLIRKAGHNLLAKMHRTMTTLTPQELTVLMQDLQAFDFSTVGGE